MRRPTGHDGRSARTEIGSSTALPFDLPAAPSAKQSSKGVGATREQRSLTERSRPSRNPKSTRADARYVTRSYAREAARSLGVELHVSKATTARVSWPSLASL